MEKRRVTCEFGLGEGTVRRLRTEAERLGLTPSRLVDTALRIYLNGLRNARRSLEEQSMQESIGRRVSEAQKEENRGD